MHIHRDCNIYDYSINSIKNINKIISIHSVHKYIKSKCNDERVCFVYRTLDTCFCTEAGDSSLQLSGHTVITVFAFITPVYVLEEVGFVIKKMI